MRSRTYTGKEEVEGSVLGEESNTCLLTCLSPEDVPFVAANTGYEPKVEKPEVSMYSVSVE